MVEKGAVRTEIVQNFGKKLKWRTIWRNFPDFTSFSFKAKILKILKNIQNADYLFL